MNYLRQFAEAGVGLMVVSAVGRSKDSKGRSSYTEGLSLASFRESSELEFGADDAFIRGRTNAVMGRCGSLLSIEVRQSGEPSFPYSFRTACKGGGLMATADRHGTGRTWSRTRWLVVSALVIAVIAAVVLILTYTGGGSSGGGGGY